MSGGTAKPAAGTKAATPCPHTYFATDDLPPRVRFATWREHLLPMVETSRDENEPPERFSAAVEAFRLGELILAHGKCSPQYMRCLHRGGVSLSTNPYSMLYFLEGECRGCNETREVHARVGDIVLLDLAKPLDVRFSRCRLLSLIVPRQLMRVVQPSLGRLQPGHVLRAGSSAASTMARYLNSIWQRLGLASRAEGLTLSQMSVGCVAAAFAGTETLAAPAIASLPMRAGLAQMQVYIKNHLGDTGLNAAHLSRQFGYSRTALYRCFKPLGGVSRYICRQRLERCWYELTRGAGTPERIADVSRCWGFGNYSHFCRLFHDAYGMSPYQAVQGNASATRTRVHAGDAAASPENATFFDWLHHATCEAG